MLASKLVLKVVILLVENYKKYGIALLVLIAIGWAGYLLGVNTAGTIDASRAAAITADLQRAEKLQRDTIARLDKIGAGLDSSAKRTAAIEARIAGVEGIIGEVAGRVDDGKVRIGRSQQLIDEGIGILQSLPKRNGPENKQPAP